jgi:hypothetical protein
MKTPFLKCFLLLLTIAIVTFSSSLVFSQDVPTYSKWSLWLGGHYTGLEDYYKKVAEFDRGKEGAMPEASLSYFGYKGDRSLDLFAHFYDPKKMRLDLTGKVKDVFSGKVSYNSFFRQRQTDLLENLTAREAVDQQNTPGAKMFTHEHETPPSETDYGYTRQELKTDFQVKVPGSAKLVLRAYHRSILEKGEDQKVVSMHCSSCHMVSKSVKVDRQTHTVSAGAEANPGPVFLSYLGSYRTFKSEAPQPEAHYDAAQHPISGDPMDFPQRVIFQDTVVAFGQIPDNEKMAHTLKAKTQVGKGEILGSFTHTQAKNKTAGIEVNGNGGTLKYVLSPSMKTRLIAQASLVRIENDDVEVDLPAWRGGDPGQFDYVRYSSLNRTVAKGSANFTYQPDRKYRLSVSAGYEGIQRDDYPYYEAKERTTKIKTSVEGKYRPSSKFWGLFKYSFENTKNPAPYNLLFERSGKDEQAPFYYYEREGLRYGEVTNQPTNQHDADLTLNFRPDLKVNLTLGLKASLQTNDENTNLDYQRTILKPGLSATLSPDPRWELFGNVSYIRDKSNGLITVAMMDG